MFAVPGT